MKSEDIVPQAPALLGKLKWLGLYGRRHLGLVVLAALVSIAGWLFMSPNFINLVPNITTSSRLRSAVNQLRLDYHKGNLEQAEQEVKAILVLDPHNGTGLYYAGELKRKRSPELFRGGCIVPGSLIPKLEFYESDFYQYLEIENELPKSETRGSYAADACYERLSGFCSERTAWINHLLANDMLEDAKLTADPQVRNEKLRRAIRFAKAALSSYQDASQNEGFVQCTSTTAVINEAKGMLQ